VNWQDGKEGRVAFRLFAQEPSLLCSTAAAQEVELPEAPHGQQHEPIAEGDFGGLPAVPQRT